MTIETLIIPAACVLYILIVFSVHCAIRIRRLKKTITDLEAWNTELTTEINKRVQASVHWNNSGTLPPVWMKLIIKTPEGEKHVKRDSWALSSDSKLCFTDIETGEEYTGRFDWRYP